MTTSHIRSPGKPEAIRMRRRRLARWLPVFLLIVIVSSLAMIVVSAFIQAKLLSHDADRREVIAGPTLRSAPRLTDAVSATMEAHIVALQAPGALCALRYAFPTLRPVA
jgi:peptidoglycan/LPS O-acetylase OafA/YrhL